MCGIAGLIRRGGIAPEDILAVKRMTAAELHRGPDADGFYSTSAVALGHRRLSIIDLSPLGAQPMANEDGTVRVSYNGEVYNHQELRRELIARGHKFRSQTDTEVIVHGYEEWGVEGLLTRLRGMFAFGLYDTRLGLILARDRLGIKPLYYFADKNTLLFASEVKALIASGEIPNEKDHDALAGFLLSGSVPAPLTTVRGVRCLQPGHYLTWTQDGIKIRKYWDLKFGNSEFTHADLRNRLEETLSRHLMSDVPLGLFLSGGVDSAALAALASHASPEPLKTLTVVFEEREFSEA